MELRERIQQQFDKYPQLKVLFFFDPSREMEEEVGQLQLDGIRLEKYAANPFNLKIKLHGEWSTERLFLYFPSPAPVTQEEMKAFPLLDVLVANKELRLGDVSDFMEQYGLKAHHQSLLAIYMSELKYAGVQQVLKPVLNATSFSKEALERGLVSAFLKFNEPQPWEFLMARMIIWSKPEYKEELTRAEKKLRDNRLEAVVAERLSDLLDETVIGINGQTLLQLAKKLKYNLILLQQEPVKGDPYAPLKIKHSISLSRVGVFFEQVRSHPKLGNAFVESLLEGGQEIKEDVILQQYSPEASYFWMPDALKWLILAEYIKQLPEEPAKALTALESMSLHYEENEAIKTLLTACLHTANCLKEINSVQSYRLNKPEDYLQQYTKGDYRIDQAYRKAIFKFNSLDQAEVPHFVELDNLQAALNDQYEAWLEKLNREWLACLQAKDFEYGQIGVPKQYDFYRSEVEPFDQKVVVFISDALRYEAAVELLNEMHNDRKSEAELRFMLASIPSKTSVGMSNLLPGKGRLFNGDDIKIDGVRADASNRQAILQKANTKAVVVTYDQVEKNNQEQNRDLFKAPVVYIYHDVIDATGDTRKSERRTFKAVEEAVAEIKQLVKRIHGNYNVSRVLITADHGFLYNDRTIAETDKEDAPDAAAIQHNRFAIYEKPVSPSLGYCIPLKSTTRFEDEYWVVVPASTNRYKRQGAGQQYVHGGASLQELVVPVIESARRREDISRKVGVKLLTLQPKIVSNILKAEVLQENYVSRYEKGRKVKAGIYNGYDLISTEQELALESASELASERMFTITLTLKQPGMNGAALTLKIFDTEDAYNALIEKPVVNNTLIEKDF